MKEPRALSMVTILRMAMIEDDLVRNALIEFEVHNKLHEFEEDAKYVVDKRIASTGKGYKHTNQGGKHYKSSMVPDIITRLKLRNMGFADPR